MFVIVVVESLDGRVFDSAIHPLDLTVRPWVTRFGQSMLDIEIGTGRFERMASKRHILRPHRLDVLVRPAVPSRIGEVRAAVGQHRVDLVGNGRSQRPEEIAGNPSSGLFDQLGEGELRCPVNGNKEV